MEALDFSSFSSLNLYMSILTSNW